VTPTAVNQAIDQPFLFTPSLAAGEPGRAAPSSTATTGDPLVNEARREIAEIVREVAQAVRSERSKPEFLAFLVDRILRAMAAEGVVMWHRAIGSDDIRVHPSETFEVVARLGNITDQSTPSLVQDVHQNLLSAIAAEQQPVVVPATPGANGPDLVANPTDFPVAVVPIQSDPSEQAWAYVLQVFLEPGCGASTQRGYLRFVAQMADLAGEFLRIDGFRRLRQGQSLANRVDEAIVRLHAMLALPSLEAATVDQAADLFGFDRVGLCDVDHQTANLVAVSHVDAIDRRSPAAEQIRVAALCPIDPHGCWFPTDVPASDDGDDLFVAAVIAPEPSSPMRLVCLQRHATPVQIEALIPGLRRYLQHADLARQHASQLTSIPGGRFWANRFLRHSTVQPGSRRRVRRAMMVAVGLMVGFLAMLPFPLVVMSTATIRPADVQTISASREALVDQIHVEHGQWVNPGDTLLTLVDIELQQQIANLIGQRAILEQQQARWTHAIVSASASMAGDHDHHQSEQRLVAEEIRAIDQQLALLRTVESSLIIRADRRGTVNAWRLEERLQNRPLRRGDHLLQVVAAESPWWVDAQVPQHRISHVETALGERLTASVALMARPHESQVAALVRLGPAFRNETDGQAATLVVLRMEHDALDTQTTFRDANVQSGAPAQVTFRCGTAPLAYVLFQDVIRTLQSTVRLYFGGQA